MPLRRRRMRKRRPARKRVRRARRGRGRKLPINRVMNGFPKYRVVRMRYQTHFTLDIGAASGNTPYKVIAANNISFPEYGGTAMPAHRPLGYDQWAGFYNQWVVIGSKCTFKSMQTGTSNSFLVSGGVVHNDPSAVGVVPSNWDLLAEQGKSRFSFQQGITNGNMPRAVTLTFSPKKWFGIKDLTDDVDIRGTFPAVVGTTPDGTGPAASRSSYYIIYAAKAAHDATDPPGTQFVCRVDYLVLCTLPKEIAHSELLP